MRRFEKVLTDAVQWIYVEDWRVSSEEIAIGDGGKWHVEKSRLRGGLSDGVDLVEVDNGQLSFVVVPTRGMGIWRGRIGDCSLGWRSPVMELVHPRHIDLEDRGGLGWLRGFNEWVVRCGLESNGAPGEDVIIDNVGNERRVMLPLHGRVANIPASEVKAYVGLEKPFELGVKGVLYERSMFGPNFKLSTCVNTALKADWIRISDIIENVGGVPAEMQILYHCNYGEPFLEEGSRIIAPIRRIAPRDRRASEGMEKFDSFGPPQAGFVEQVYFFDLIGDEEKRTCIMLTNRSRTKAVSISWSLQQLPCFTLWKNTSSHRDGYVVGLEPATNFPNHRGFERERGRVVNLKPGEEYAADLLLRAHLGREEVANVERLIEETQGSVEPRIFTEPNPEFSPG